MKVVCFQSSLWHIYTLSVGILKLPAPDLTRYSLIRAETLRKHSRRSLEHQEMQTLLSVLSWGMIDIIAKKIAIAKNTMIAWWGFYHKYDDYYIFPIAIIASIGAPKFLYKNSCTNLSRNYS